MAAHLLVNSQYSSAKVHRINRTKQSIILEPSSPQHLLAIDDNRDIYIGQVVNGIMQGHGVLIDQINLATYVGNWRCNQMHGKGTYSDQLYHYCGSWSDNQMNGDGSLIRHDTSNSFNGEFEKGVLISGTASYVGGGEYCGTFLNLIQHGFGEMQFNDGSVYHGGWEQGQFDGHGQLTSTQDHSEYEGQFVSNLKYGKGTLTFADGRTFQGRFVDDCTTDEGVWYIPQTDRTSKRKRKVEVVYID
jgi:hypothetical protein